MGSFFTETKKRDAGVGIQGLEGPLSLPCWGKTGLCDKDTHTKAVQIKHKSGAFTVDQGDSTEFRQKLQLNDCVCCASR